MMLTTSLLASLLALPQTPPLPFPKAATQRYVDFSEDLARPDVAVVLGSLERLREGKRERLEEGRLGGSTTQVAVSGTQYYKVPVVAQLETRFVLHGEKPAKRRVAFEFQLARLPDGSERRQTIGGNGAPIEADRLALWVVATPKKGRNLELLHVIAFDPGTDESEVEFEELARDVTAVNVHVAALRAVLARLDDEDLEPETREKALAEARALLDHPPELQDPERDALLTMHAGPWRSRVRKAVGGDG